MKATRKEIASRDQRATATATDYCFRVIAELGVVIIGWTAAALKLIAGEHETTSLDGDVADSGEPRVAGVCGRCAQSSIPLEYIVVRSRGI